MINDCNAIPPSGWRERIAERAYWRVSDGISTTVWGDGGACSRNRLKNNGRSEEGQCDDVSGD